MSVILQCICTSFRSNGLTCIRKSQLFHSLPWSKFLIISLAVILVVAQRVGQSSVLVKVSA